jgi:hypothetical protein
VVVVVVTVVPVVVALVVVVELLQEAKNKEAASKQLNPNHAIFFCIGYISSFYLFITFG